ncbi:50S ribosomal protein L19-2, chloroplastic-like isoform X2 [Mangifera indica]|uniref:50S ribosomal protein L19-2, chloroplastic-like isoform X2 n=1 Tax=Mangifera indica TaxID=29780 RepID=UPI001CF93AA3|nr:50S ribosomal protein L19-2, chloroplastic-like isoform X2 [Mangifera indica]
MLSFRGSIQLVQRHYCTANTSSLITRFLSSKSTGHLLERLPQGLPSPSQVNFGSQTESSTSVNYYGRSTSAGMFQPFASRCISTVGNSVASASQYSSAAVPNVAPRIKFKRLDKTARHIMQILDKEAVEEVKGQREIPDIRPGYIVQLKVEVPENKRRVSIVKGIVIARRNAGLNTTFRLRRLVAGVGVENLFMLRELALYIYQIGNQTQCKRDQCYYSFPGFEKSCKSIYL